MSREKWNRKSINFDNFNLELFKLDIFNKYTVRIQTINHYPVNIKILTKNLHFEKNGQLQRRYTRRIQLLKCPSEINDKQILKTNKSPYNTEYTIPRDFEVLINNSLSIRSLLILDNLEPLGWKMFYRWFPYARFCSSLKWWLGDWHTYWGVNWII